MTARLQSSRTFLTDCADRRAIQLQAEGYGDDILGWWVGAKFFQRKEDI